MSIKSFDMPLGYNRFDGRVRTQDVVGLVK